MKSVNTPERSSDSESTLSPTSTSDRVQYATMSSSVSPPMSPSAFSATSPIPASPEARSSKFSIPLPFQARSITRAATTDSIFRSRSKSPRKPPPTDIYTKPTGSTPAPPPNHPLRMKSEPAASPTSPAHPTSPSRPTLKRTRKTSGTTSHYGRHSNDWLFGGISVRETVKGIWKDNDGQDH